MKAFWISILSMLFLFVIWSIFMSYTEVDMDKMVSDIDAASGSIENGDWSNGQDFIVSVSRLWYDRRLGFSLFFDAVSISDVEASLVRAYSYCSTGEKGSALAELANLRHQLLFLYENELITIENIL